MPLTRSIYSAMFYDKPIDGKLVFKIEIYAVDDFEANHQAFLIAKATDTYSSMLTWIGKEEVEQ